MPTAGYAVLQIIPSVRGVSEELRRQLVGPAGDAGDRAGRSAGAGFKAKLRAGAAAAGAAAGALLVAGIGKAMDRANIAGTLQAQLGTTNKVAAQHGKTAGDLYSKGVSGSFQEAADAIKAVVQGGLAPPGATNRQLQSIATKASDVASVFGQDLGGVTNAVSQLMRTGLAESSTEAFDILTRGFQLGADKGGDLLDTVNEYGVQFKKAGLDGSAAMGLISQAIQAGARDSDIAADAIKEFSIRAVDGSDSTAAGFRMLGLDADAMAARFAQGGSAANGVLDLTLDRLRGVKDPVRQAQAATALFGTQAEDLGTALLAMDPSSAARKLGDFGGATQRVGETIRSGPSYEIETFKRRLEQGFVEVLGTHVLPVVTQFGHALNATVGPALRAVLGPLGSLAAAFTASPGAMRATAVVLSVLVAQFAALKAVAGVRAAVSGLWGGLARLAAGARAGAAQVRFLAFAVRYYTVIAARAAAQAVRTGAAWGASGARAAGAWVAARARAAAAFAQTSASAALHAGRAGAAWAASGARTAGVWTLARIRAAAAFGATAASAAGNALRTTAAWTAAGARSAGAWVLFRVRAAAEFARASASAALHGARSSAAWVASQARSAAATAAMTVRLAAQRAAMLAGTAATRAMAAAQWLLNAALRANPIILVITLLAALGAGLVLAYRRSAAFRAVVQAAFRAVRAVAATVVAWFTGTFLPFFTRTLPSAAVALKNRVVGAFQALRDGLGRAMDGIRNAARTPVNWVIRVVWNEGIVSLWKKVAGWIPGVPKLGKLPLLARGGTVPARPGVFSEPTAIVGEGRSQHPEFVIPTDPRYRGRALALWQAAGGQLMEDGGILGGIKKIGRVAKGMVSGALDFLTDPLGAVGKLLDPVLDKLKEVTGSAWGKMAAGLPRMAVKGLKDMVNKGIGSLGGALGLGDSSTGGGGSGVRRWARVVQHALRLTGQPAGYTALTLRRMNQEPAGNPRAVNLWDSNAKAGHPSVGLMQVIRPTFQRWAGPFRGTGPFMYGVSINPLANVYSSMKYALGTYGSLPRAYNRAGGYDHGGLLPPGLTLAYNYNGTRKPERVLTDAQWERIAAHSGTGGERPTVIYVQPPPADIPELIDGIGYALRRARRGGLYAAPA